jgi:gliding motility-associated-like protein
MNAVLDSMIGVIQPEMQGQFDKWGGTMAEWEENVQTLRDFIDTRCLEISTGLIDCYNLTGPFDIVVNVEPAGAGRVKVNSEWAPFYPWASVQYGNINTLFKASANADYVFDYWSAGNHTFVHLDSINDTLDFSSNDTIVAHFIYTDTIVDPVIVDPSGVTGAHIPNAFSPNGDGTNDFLEFFIGYDIVSFDLLIVDRWGQVMFQTNVSSTFWDGRYKSKYVNSGVYSYILNYKLDTGQELKKSGNITLVR